MILFGSCSLTDYPNTPTAAGNTTKVKNQITFLAATKPTRGLAAACIFVPSYIRAFVAYCFFALSLIPCLRAFVANSFFVSSCLCGPPHFILAFIRLPLTQSPQRFSQSPQRWIRSNTSLRVLCVFSSRPLRLFLSDSCIRGQFFLRVFMPSWPTSFSYSHSFGCP